MSTSVLEPRRGALILCAARVSHRVDVYSQGVTETALHIMRRQVDEERRQLAVPSSGADPVRCLDSHYRPRFMRIDVAVGLKPVASPASGLLGPRRGQTTIGKRTSGMAQFHLVSSELVAPIKWASTLCVTAVGKEGRMPLSDHEQRMLEQIESALYAEDPKFASSVRGAGCVRRLRADGCRVRRCSSLGWGCWFPGLPSRRR
ncbi:hypothetical protein I553_3452 [Mycobacterium xenopi 4042]|uniref:Uncharacterized protein n=1 Tax=Mycobacterium xenopi 4042 TaxID=1299334 RepID=X7ZXG0_MYCXE|nr:hypothetical protein I553_3452 [Mycobacterium xenopi 4042]